MAKAQVTISGQDNLTPVVENIEKRLGSFAQATNKIGNTLKTAFSVTAVVAGVKKLGDAAASCLKDFLSAERSYKQLSLTLGDGSAYQSVVDNINKLSRQTLASKDQIESMVSELAGLGKSSSEINKVSDAAVYLSNVTGKDLNSSMTTLLNTYNGNVKELKKLGIDTSDLTSRQLQQGAAIDLVVDKFKDLSNAMAEADTSQHLQNISNNVGDIKQSFGDLIDFAIGPLISKLDTATTKIKDTIDDMVQKAKVIFENFPEAMGILGSMVSKLFSVEGIQTIITGVFGIISKHIKLVGDAIANLFQLAVNIASAALKGIGNYAMYWISYVCDKLGIDLSEIINTIGQWLTESPIGKFVDSVITGAVNGIRMIAALIKNLPAMVKLVIDNIDVIVKGLWTSVKGVFFTLLSDITEGIANLLEKINLPQRVEDIKTDFQNLFGRIGGWFEAIGATAKDTFRYIGDILKATFKWETIKTIIVTLFKNIGIIGSTAIKALFQSIPAMVESIFQGIISWVSYLAVKIKNDIGDAIIGVLDEKIPDWVKDLTGWDFDSKKADRTTENNLKAKADASFANVGTITRDTISSAIDSAALIKENNQAIADCYASIEGINVATSSWEDISAAIVQSNGWAETLHDLSDALANRVEDTSDTWNDIGEQFAVLLDPVFEKFSMNSGATIGQAMAKWTKKSTDEYFKAAKENFSSIGDFIQDFGKTFLSDLGDDWEELSDTLSSVFGDLFGDDMDSFVALFQKVVDKLSEEGGGGGGESSVFGSFMLDQFTSKMGEAGTALTTLTTNISSMGGAMGTLATVVEYIFQGLAEVIGPTLGQMASLLIEPLIEFGRILGEMLMPILDMCMPLIKQIAEYLMEWWSMMSAVLQPLLNVVMQVLNPVLKVLSSLLSALMPVFKVFATALTAVSGTIEYLVQSVMHFVAVFINWLGGLHIWGWYPFGGLHMDDPGAPGSYSKFMDNKFDSLDAAFTSGQDKANSWNTDSTSTSTSVSSAGYQGATQVTINIYQQAPIVGDGGMRAFASMIRDEFDALNYYGVTT